MESRWALAERAALCLAVAGPTFGGIVVKARHGPVRDAWRVGLRSALPHAAPWGKIPSYCSIEQLQGGIDLAATLQRGHAVRAPGLIERLQGAENGEQLFVSAPERLAHNGPGSHLRHIHDLYLCFLRDRTGGAIDYDRRDRDERFERDPAYAAKTICGTMKRLSALTEADLEGEVSVRMDADPADQDAFQASTFERELTSLLSHTIHHYALVALILRAQDFQCEPEFGVAPATLDYWKRSGVCAPSLGASS